MRKFILILMLITCFTLPGKEITRAYKSYTFADSLWSVLLVADNDTAELIIPRADTTIDTNLYGKIDTIIEYSEIFPSLFEQQSVEGIIEIDSASAYTSYATFDRWAMENWAIAIYLADSGGEAADTVGLEILYSFDKTRWTVPYTLTTGATTLGTMLTYYPLDLYDNWKLYHWAKLRAYNKTNDSTQAKVWIVGRIKNLISNE
jgi:hypothetical protein